MTNERPVIVLQLPEKLILGQADLFFREIKAFLTADRPRVVFDFSAVKRLDSAGVEMLLNSMEEVMKRNGDLKLAALTPSQTAILEVTRVDELFEVFDNTSDAVESFHQFPVHALRAMQPWHGSARESGSTV